MTDKTAPDDAVKMPDEIWAEPQDKNSQYGYYKHTGPERGCMKYIRADLVAHQGQEPVVYMHRLKYETGDYSAPKFSPSISNPFGKAGVDFSAEYECTPVPLYAASEVKK